MPNGGMPVPENILLQKSTGSHNEETREFSLKSFVKFVFIVPGTAILR